MIKRELTKLEKGIRVKINPQELERLKKEHNGFLDRIYYPEDYEDIAEEGELGRFLIFRFFSE